MIKSITYNKAVLYDELTEFSLKRLLYKSGFSQLTINSVYVPMR